MTKAIMKNYSLWLLLLGLTAFQGCEKEEITILSEPNGKPLIESEEINDFIWKNLNTHYYWQESVPNLADSKADNLAAYAALISGSTKPESFFKSLLHREDRFSQIISDYKEPNASLNRLHASNGAELGFFKYHNQLIGYVRYVHSNSDASQKNLKRGDLFVGVNGKTLVESNYNSLLFGKELTYTLNMGELINGQIKPNGVDIKLTKTENFQANAIHIEKILEIGGKKIGYLMYNKFSNKQNAQLNDAFGRFKNEGVSDLVLDLRYNGGGNLNTCIYLASMITGQFTGEVFVKRTFNSKFTPVYNNFVNKMDNGIALNSLNLNKIYVIATSLSASASELLINGLSPYIEVIHIGDTTVGKNVGAITLKDESSKYAIQPITFKVANKDEFSDYMDGLKPDIFQREMIGALGVLGNSDELLLRIALNQVSGLGNNTNLRQGVGIPIQSEIIAPSTLKQQQMFLDEDSMVH